jgi:hypothetical protein
MEMIKLIWFINIFFLVLTILFVWSKLLIISKRVTSLKSIIDDIENLYKEDESDNK